MLIETAAAPRGPLTMALALRDPCTHDHGSRVEALCVALGRAFGFAGAALDTLRDAARLHDIGKIGIPDGILLKPGPLDPDERAVMRRHAAAGAEICARMDRPDAAELALMVRHHHERFDGRGYPDGLAGTAIPLGARIIGVVDSYDAMGTRRPYHPGRTHEEIMAVMHEERGAKSDPEVFDRFVAMVSMRPGATAA